jgi:hypothetical protein
MNKNLTIAVIAMVAVIMGISAFAPAMADKPGTTNDDKVVICHLPNGDASKARTISVSDDVETMEDHMSHGDSMGACLD